MKNNNNKKKKPLDKREIIIKTVAITCAILIAASAIGIALSTMKW